MARLIRKLVMKRCPLCNRTYADETISFCLADGELLSAPYDPQATEQLPAARSTDPPPTEILPHTPNPNPTQPAKEAVPVYSTMASPVSPNIPRRGSLHESPAMKQPSRWPWIVGGLFILLAVGVIFIIGYNLGIKKPESSNDNSSATNPSLSPPPEANINASPANSNSIVQDSPANNSNDANPRVPGIVPDNGNVANSKTAPTPETKEPPPVDYNRVFNPSEVDQKARIVSKPSPEYTEEARQNQVTGTITLRMVFSASGAVTNIRALTSLPYGLTEKAVAAARGIKFTPAMKDGRPVSQYIQVEYNFNIY